MSEDTKPTIILIREGFLESVGADLFTLATMFGLAAIIKWTDSTGVEWALGSLILLYFIARVRRAMGKGPKHHTLASARKHLDEMEAKAKGDSA